MKFKTALFILALFFLQAIHAQTPKEILDTYELIWSDEFNGSEIDTTKWNYRSLGDLRKLAVVYKENSYVNGKGQLIIETSKQDSIYKIGQIGTQHKFSAKYGYFECSAKMNKELGPHVAFWLQSPFIHEEKNDPKTYGTEIDIFEYHINEGKNFVFHNLHWNGYKKHHKSTGTKIKIEGIDEGYHTFGLEWTPTEYIFYVDGKETWRTSEAISHIPQYLILSAELTGWGGNFENSNFPDKVYFDYVRVYKKK